MYDVVREPQRATHQNRQHANHQPHKHQQLAKVHNQVLQPTVTAPYSMLTQLI